METRPFKAVEFLENAKGAFVNIVTWASDADEYRRNAELVLGKLGLSVVDIENPEPVSARKKRAGLAEAIEDMVGRAQNNPNAIIYGSFHTWKRDDA